MSPERCPATHPIMIKEGDEVRRSKVRCIRLDGHLYDHMCKMPNGDLKVFPRTGWRTL